MAFSDIGSSVNPLNFTINGRAFKFPDIQRNFMWQLLIPNVRSVAPSASFGAEDLLVRCRSISIPQRSNEAITSNFMGTRQFFPGRADPGGGTVSVDFEDTEDMVIQRVFYEWQQNIFNINPASPTTAGKSKWLAKRMFTKDMFLMLYNYGGFPLPKQIRFHNAWVQNVNEISMSYDSNESVKYAVTFQYDYWTLFPDDTIK